MNTMSRHGKSAVPVLQPDNPETIISAERAFPELG